MDTAAERRARAIAAFRAENSRDPTLIPDGSELRPKELVDAERLAAWALRLEPQASDALLLASHCQHLRRWELPRSEFPDGRIGYLTWRKALARRHADLAEEILRREGYDEATLLAVRQINLKQGLHTNPDVQAMEDALCLSFLEHELADFAEKHPDEKVIDIIAKTWAKMSDRGHQAALALPLDPRAGALVARALERSVGPGARG
jgi:hypothetical protein